MVAKKILAIFACMLMIPLIPAATAVSTESNDKGTTDNLIGWCIVRGITFNPREIGQWREFRAIRVHYTVFTPMETSIGVLRFELFKVRQTAFNTDLVYMGKMGMFAWFFGIFRGDLIDLGII